MKNLEFYLKCTRTQFWVMVQELVTQDNLEAGGAIFGPVYLHQDGLRELGQGAAAWTLGAFDDNGKTKLEVKLPDGANPPALESILTEAKARGWLKKQGGRKVLPSYDMAWEKYKKGTPITKIVSEIYPALYGKPRKKAYDRIFNAIDRRKERENTTRHFED